MSNANELVITRTFNAPRSLVWKAWTDPRQILQWWGPKGFTNTSCEVSLEVGGTFRLVMCSPDGITYPCLGIYREIIEPERIVYSSEADELACGAGLPPRSVVTVTFAEQGKQTLLTVRTQFESDLRREAAINGGYSVGWASCLERLGDYLNA